MKKFLLIFSLLVIGIGLVGALGFLANKKNTAALIQEVVEVVVPTQEELPVTDEQLKKEIGQMVLLGFRGTAVSQNSDIAKIIQDLQIGGVILFDYDNPSKSFPRNIISPTQTKTLISNLQMYSSTPLFVSVDAEGGNVNRLKEKYGFEPVMSAAQMSQKGLGVATQEMAKLADELSSLGFNMNFAPVLDVNVNPSNPVIGKLGRSFSADPAIVTEYAKAFIKEQKKVGIISVEKHFPGHGSSTTDSHLGLVDVTKTYQEKELLPYQELQQGGLLDVVMTAHVMNKNIDADYPATLSTKFLQDKLRKELKFEGVIISDDMQMNAIVDHFGFEEAVLKAVEAGCDVLILSNNGAGAYDSQLAYKAVNTIFNAVKEGKISAENIHASYKRILALKKKFSIIQN